MTGQKSAPAWQGVQDGAGGDVVVDVKNLRVVYDTPRGEFAAVNGVSFQVYRGETLGLVGESGSGKSTTAMAMLRLLPSGGRIAGGEVDIDDVDMLGLNQRELRRMRWKKVSLIPQGAMNSLNPVMRISDQIADCIVAHEGRQSGRVLKQRIHGLLEDVGLSSRVYELYPHELSGGMKQRVCIAMAIALNPSLIVADEPTSALDVVVQRLITQTLQDVKKRLGVSMLLIGHDMGLQAQVVDRLAVMYKGNIVELAPVESAFADPLHPYTRLLIAAIPSIKERKDIRQAEQLAAELHRQPGCLFQFRCPHTAQECASLPPLLQEAKPGHYVACHLYEEEDERMRSYVSTAAPTPA